MMQDEIDFGLCSELETEFHRNRMAIANREAELIKLGVQNVVDYFDVCRSLCDGKQVALEQVEREESLTYDELETRSNQIAHWALAVGLQPGSPVAVMLPNSPLFVTVWLGLAKLGCVIPCINTHLSGHVLANALATAAASALIVDSRYSDQLTAAQQQDTVTMSGVRILWSTPVSQPKGQPNETDSDADQFALQSYLTQPSDRVSASFRAHLTLDDPLFYIYTSGTTGPSKAALFSHRRFMGAGVTWSRHMRLSADDRYYIVLPMYHGNGGVVALSAVWHSGCTAVIREKFSASAFWKDVQAHRCTAMVYIGELWRYLHNRPVCEEEKNNPLRVIAGNGLRSDIWMHVVERFGIQHVVEHYGLTEMPAGPYVNSYGRVGACGYLPPQWRAQRADDKLILFDTETQQPAKTDSNEYQEVTIPGVAGEAIFRLRREYRGYTDPRASVRRVYKDVFSSGDMWFATGDLLRFDGDGFFYFVDRLGDSFRWKGENVSTNEVCEVIGELPFVAEANVYGVEFPNREGKAGMVAIGVSPHRELDLNALFRHTIDRLPAYARPLFVRVLPSESEKTSTFKFQKSLYQRDGFNPDNFADTVYFLDETAQKYVVLTPELYRTIINPLFRV